MKMKQIEKVPYLGAKKTGKGFQYVAVAAVKIIAKEKHLIVEVYRNKKSDLKVPVIRIALNKTGWSNYIPESGTWDKRKIENNYYSTNLWGESKEKTFISEQDEQRVIKWCNDKCKWGDWINKIESFERGIRYAEQSRAETRKKQALEERNKLVKPLSEEFKQWCREVLFKDRNYIYYKRKRNKATFKCSHCGREYEYKTNAPDTFEGQFQHVGRIPVNGERGRCEACDNIGVYKPIGNMKEQHEESIECYTAQKYKDTGAVIHAVNVKKIFRKDMPATYEYIEIARNYFTAGKNIQKDYHLHDGWTNRDFWSYQNIGGMRNIVQGRAPVYPGAFEELKGTILEYSGLKEFMNDYATVGVTSYMQTYVNIPQLEMISKLGMTKLADTLIGYTGQNEYIKVLAGKPEDMLGIRKERIKQLILHKGEPKMLKIMQMEKASGDCWSEEEIRDIYDLGIERKDLLRALEFMSVRKFLNRVEKYTGKTIAESWGSELERMKGLAILYIDYLHMKRRAGYDMNNMIHQFPRDIREAHKAIVDETVKKEEDKRFEYVESNYPNIKKKYRTFYKKYHYEDEAYLIRPARSASEIVLEGRTLHHCVGGDSYLKYHNNGEHIILMLRKKENLDMPYITVEIRDKRINQWYGEYDKKPDKDIMEKWIESYVTRLVLGNFSYEENSDIAEELDNDIRAAV